MRRRNQQRWLEERRQDPAYVERVKAQRNERRMIHKQRAALIKKYKDMVIDYPHIITYVTPEIIAARAPQIRALVERDREIINTAHVMYRIFNKDNSKTTELTADTLSPTLYRALVCRNFTYCTNILQYKLYAVILNKHGKEMIGPFNNPNQILQLDGHTLKSRDRLIKLLGSGSINNSQDYEGTPDGNEENS